MVGMTFPLLGQPGHGRTAFVRRQPVRIVDGRWLGANTDATGFLGPLGQRVRLEKELGRIDTEIARIDGKLANADFIKRAPEEVVEGERERREEAQARRCKIVEALERLRGASLN